MPSRFEYERAVRASGLPPMSRLMALTLATWADLKTGVIPPHLMPSLSKLEEATGMSRGSVRTHLDKLEADGWLLRKRPSVAAARSEKARTQYTLRIPKGATVPDSDRYEVEQEQASSGVAPTPELGQELPQARAGATPELGQELTTARAGAALSSSFSSLPTPPPLQPVPQQDPASTQTDDAAGTDGLAAAAAFLEALPAPWTIGPRSAKAMAPQLLEMASRQGWQLDQTLVAKLTEKPGGIHHHPTVLRLRIVDLPRRTTPAPAAAPAALPVWCGDCADGNPAAAKTGHIRQVYDDAGSARPCPKCHPSQTRPAA
jgi:hypothetical protein